MGGVCLCCSWTCRSVWPLFVFLAAVPCVLHCSEGPAAVVGKMYPRGNHWAVGHLMGKKSVESLQEVNYDSDYLTPSENTARATELDRYQRLMEVLMRPVNQKKRTIPQAGERLLRPHSSWREEDKEAYLREMSNLLLLALKLQDNDST